MKPLPFREVKRRLEAAGFSQVGQTGSHVKFAKTTTEGVRTATSQSSRSCGRHLAQHLRQAGISAEDFEAL